MSNKILFLDLDGTVRRTKSGATFINDPYDQELIPGVEEAIARYHNWLIIGITNQDMVSDRPEDEQCAKNANVPFMWAEDWKNGR